MATSSTSMLSLMSVWLVVISSSLVAVQSRPRAEHRPGQFTVLNRENHPRADRGQQLTAGSRFDNSGASTSHQQFIPASLNPKEFAYNRMKRELRNSRKIDSSNPQMHMPMRTYYPFIMAEMMPGSVKTRHPSIIAVNGCPAFFIADHKGRCRQVFQYTVQFGQKSASSGSPQETPTEQTHNDRNVEENSHSHRQHHPQALQPTEVPSHPSVHYIPTSHSTPTTTNPRLLSVLRNAAKNFDLSFLSRNQQSSSTSGEVKTGDENIEKLRQKLLKALKITKDKNDSKKQKEESKNNKDDDD